MHTAVGGVDGIDEQRAVTERVRSVSDDITTGAIENHCLNCKRRATQR